VTDIELERRVFRLMLQVHRRGYFMFIDEQLRPIVERRLMRKLFLHWRMERNGEMRTAI
jgi:hypothetical protein